MSQPNLKIKTRADIVRERRQIKKTPLKSTSTRSSKTTTQPTGNLNKVTVRRTSSQPVNPRSQAPRKKVYMPMKTPGAEIALPSLPNIQLGWRIVSGLLAIGMLILAIGMREMSIFQISNINLIGAERIKSERIVKKLELARKPLVELMPDELENMVLETYPDIKSVAVRLKLPAVVNMTITERVPAILWTRPDGSSDWIDKEGFLFPVRGEGLVTFTVFANGEPPTPIGMSVNEETDLEELMTDDSEKAYVPKPSVDPEFVEAVLLMQNYVPEETQLLYDPQYGLGWEDTRGWKVYFGPRLEDIELKLAEYNKIVENLIENNIKPVLISLEFLHAPFYRLEL